MSLPLRWIRSAAGLVAGVVATALLSGMADAVVLHSGARATVPLPLELLLLGMRGLAALAGGYLAARVAGHRPVAHGLAAAVGFLIVVQVAPVDLLRLGRSPAMPALWAAATAVVVTLVGGTLGGAARGQVRRQLRSSELDH